MYRLKTKLVYSLANNKIKNKKFIFKNSKNFISLFPIHVIVNYYIQNATMRSLCPKVITYFYVKKYNDKKFTRELKKKYIYTFGTMMSDIWRVLVVFVDLI